MNPTGRVTEVGERLGREPHERLLVVHDEHLLAISARRVGLLALAVVARRSPARGRYTVNVLPAPTVLATSIAPSQLGDDTVHE